MPYRDDLEELEHRCKALEAESAVLGAELATARQLRDEAQARRHLPVLDDLRVAAPCRTDWASMLGDERVRFCGQCEKNVYNLSALTRSEAEALLVAKEGKLCVRYYQRTDGTILTADCPVGVKRRRRRRRIGALAFGALSALSAAGAAWFARPSTKLARVEVVKAPRPVVEPPPKTIARAPKEEGLRLHQGGAGFPRREITSKTIQTNGMSNRDREAQEVLDARQRFGAGLEWCFERALKTNPDLQGASNRYDVQLTITAAGGVRAVSVVGKDKGLKDCLQAKVSTWNFKPARADFTAQFPIVFN